MGSEKSWKSLLLELRYFGIALALPIMSTNALFLNLNDLPLPQHLVLPTSFLTAVRIFHTGFLTAISPTPAETEERLSLDWLSHA